MTLVRFIIAIVYTMVGVSGCVTFFYLKNYPSGVLGAATGIINGILSYLHYLNYKNKLQELYTPQHLRQMASLGFYTFAAGTSVFIYFLVVEIMQKMPILPIEDSAVIPMIWSLITLKSGLILLYFGRSYGREEHTLLREEPVQEENSSETEEITP